MAFFDWLFGSDDPAPVQGVQHSVSTVPEYISGPTARMLQAGEQLVGQPYQPYGGPRVAPFTPDELAAFQQTRDIQGVAPDRIAQGYGIAAGAAAPITGEELSGYMNPYLQNVAGQTISELQRNRALQGQQDAAAAVSAGAFGGSREGVLRGMRDRDLGMQISDVMERTMAGGYDRAMEQALQQRQQALQTGVGLTGIAAQGQAADVTDISTLYGMGGQQRGMDQANLDLAYEDFTRQQEYPYNQLGYLSGLITGAAGTTPRETTTTTTAPGAQQPGALTTIGGLGLAGLGTYANLYGSGAWQSLKGAF